MQENIDIIISRFLSKEANNEEVDLLKDWLEANSENKEYFAQLEKIYYSTQILENKNRFNPLEAYNQFKNQKKRKTISLYKRLLPIAATFAITAGLSFFYHTISLERNVQSNELTVVEAPFGSKSNVILPDGSKVILNANSRLEYTTNFNRGNREVYLEGEGYFDVAKDENKRFIVKTSDIEIKVFGTVFNVKSYPDEKFIETTLVEGSIAIHKNESEGNTKLLQLKPNQTATFVRRDGDLVLEEKQDEVKKENREDLIVKPKQKIENILISEDIDPVDYTAWKDDILIFKNERFESIANKLERQYGAKVHFTDPEMKEYRFTGTFNEVSVEQALNALQFASHFNYQIDENKIYISK